MLLCFVTGVAFLFVKGLLTRQGTLQSNRIGLLLLFPFLAVWCAAIAGIYPYIGSRHTVFLAPFAMAAACYLIGCSNRSKALGRTPHCGSPDGGVKHISRARPDGRDGRK